MLKRLCTPAPRPLVNTPTPARATGEGAAAGAGAPSSAVYYPYESGPCPLISNGVAPQIFAASIAPGERLGADAATLRRTLESALPTLLHNLPWGSDAAMYAMAAPNLTLTLTLTLPLFLTRRARCSPCPCSPSCAARPSRWPSP